MFDILTKLLMFNKIKLDIDNSFNKLSSLHDFEDICQGKKGGYFG